MYAGVEGAIIHAGPAPEKTTEGSANKEGKLPAEENTVASSTTPLLQRKIQQLEKQSRPFDVYMAGSKNLLKRASARVELRGKKQNRRQPH